MATADLAAEARRADVYKMEHDLELTLTDFMKHLSAVVARGGFALPAGSDAWTQIIHCISTDPDAQSFIGGGRRPEEISDALTNLCINQYFKCNSPSFDSYFVSPDMAEHQMRDLGQHSDKYRAFVHRSARMVEARFALRRG